MWRCDTAAGLRNREREEKGSKSNSSCNAKGVKIPTRTAHIDGCNQTHDKAGRRHARSNFLCKMHKFCETNGQNAASVPTEKHFSSCLIAQLYQLLKHQKSAFCFGLFLFFCEYKAFTVDAQ